MDNEAMLQAMLDAAISQRNGALNENLQLVGMLAKSNARIAELEKSMKSPDETQTPPAE